MELLHGEKFALKPFGHDRKTLRFRMDPIPHLFSRTKKSFRCGFVRTPPLRPFLVEEQLRREEGKTPRHKTRVNPDLFDVYDFPVKRRNTKSWKSYRHNQWW